jgi:Cdc6-like AAA superfamily ATPase
MKTATLISVGLGLLAGWFWGDEVRRRKDAEAKVDNLAKQLQKSSFKTLPPEAQLKKMAIVLYDAHKKITAVTKALVKPAQ